MQQLCIYQSGLLACKRFTRLKIAASRAIVQSGVARWLHIQWSQLVRLLLSKPLCAPRVLHLMLKKLVPQ
jgi:hypothetical protein